MILQSTHRVVCVLLFGFAIAGAVRCDASDVPAKAEKSHAPRIDVISITIHPAALPTPTLKYHLLPTFLSLRPGNAVPYYMKALIAHMQGWPLIRPILKDNSKSNVDRLSRWIDMPVDQLPREDIRKMLKEYGATSSLSLRMAVHRERCEWDLPLREGKVFEILMPDIQELRMMARIVAVQARLQIAEGKFDDAIASLQIGYAMARHVAEQPFLVSGLMGRSMATVMNAQLLALCQQPGAPNLYWSITELPSPLIDPLKSIDAEYDGLYLHYPELADARNASYAPGQWDLILRKFVTDLVRFRASSERAKMSEKQQADEATKSILRALEAVPEAKAALVAAGYSREEVGAMVPSQIVILDALEQYNVYQDELFQWWHAPYWVADKELRTLDLKLPDARKHDLIMISAMHSPAGLADAMYSFVSMERQLAALRCIEALRLYAAQNNGKLPASLDEVRSVPIPRNPVTGRAFGYRLDKDTGVLDLDGGPASKPTAQYRISVAK